MNVNSFGLTKYEMDILYPNNTRLISGIDTCVHGHLKAEFWYTSPGGKSYCRQCRVRTQAKANRNHYYRKKVSCGR